MVYAKRDMITRVNEIDNDLVGVKTQFLACYFLALRNPIVLSDKDFCFRFQEFIEIDKNFYLAITELKRAPILSDGSGLISMVFGKYKRRR